MFIRPILLISALVLGFAGRGAQAASFPLLSGAYTYTDQSFCQIGLLATSNALKSQGGNYVESLSSPSTSSNTLQLSFGTISFTQGSTAGGGTAAISGIGAGGSTMLLSQTGAGNSGYSGAKMAQASQQGSGTFVQTATTIKIVAANETLSFNIYYGKVLSGIAQNATFGGLDSKGCANIYTITHS